mmetsp:Transcript_114757/g.357396  ORF Transcript_114757/g.357396 Transcript_114757/m.357396 type:complete len:201 (-) Transcript_114757:1303-1905(-)
MALPALPGRALHSLWPRRLAATRAADRARLLQRFGRYQSCGLLHGSCHPCLCVDCCCGAGRQARAERLRRSGQPRISVLQLLRVHVLRRHDKGKPPRSRDAHLRLQHRHLLGLVAPIPAAGGLPLHAGRARHGLQPVSGGCLGQPKGELQEARRGHPDGVPASARHQDRRRAERRQPRQLPEAGGKAEGPQRMRCHGSRG